MRLNDQSYYNKINHKYAVKNNIKYSFTFVLFICKHRVYIMPFTNYDTRPKLKVFEAFELIKVIEYIIHICLYCIIFKIRIGNFS